MDSPTLPLTVVCWLWRGWRPVYKPQHVVALRNMVKEHLAIPHRFVCVTNEDVPGVECWPMWSAPVTAKGRSLPNCFHRLKLFAMPGPYLSIDLDCVILRDFTHLVEIAQQHEFMAVAGTVCRINGSMWYTRDDEHKSIWTTLNASIVTEAKQKRTDTGRRPIGSDQVVMSYYFPNCPLWTREQHGVYQYVWGNRRKMRDPSIVFFAGRRKPWDAVEFKTEYDRYLESC